MVYGQQFDSWSNSRETDYPVFHRYFKARARYQIVDLVSKLMHFTKVENVIHETQP